jgi:hypothetical protein
MMHLKIGRSYITVLNVFILLFTLPYVSGSVSASSEVRTGVKAGDWIMLNYTFVNAPNATSSPSNASFPSLTWIKVEILSVNTTQVSVDIRMTTHMSDGTEINQTGTLNLTIGAETEPVLFSGLIVPADLAVGDSAYVSPYGNATITSETTRTYVGVSRSVVLANFSYQSQLVTQELTFYWDKETGVIVETEITSASTNGTLRAVETNMWQPQVFTIPVDWTFSCSLVAAAGILIALVFVWRRRKKTTDEKPTERPVDSLRT